MTMISKTALVLATLVSLAPLGAAHAEDNDKLLIVNGHGHVVYDDGRNDLFCVRRHTLVGYDGVDGLASTASKCQDVSAGASQEGDRP